MTFEQFREGTPSWPDVKPALHKDQYAQCRHEEKGSQLIEISKLARVQYSLLEPYSIS